MRGTPGGKRYHGKPCRHGHGTERFTFNGNCVECARLAYAARAPELQKNWRARNPDKARDIGRRSERKRRLDAEFNHYVASLTEEAEKALAI